MGRGQLSRWLGVVTMAIAVGPLAAASARAQPIAVDRRVASATNSVCVIGDDGRVTCAYSWTSRLAGAMAGREVAGVERARSLALGDVAHCALLEDGEVVCWAAPGHLAHRRGVVRVPELRSAAQLAAGTFAVCGRFADGRVRCMRKDDSGFVGAVVDIPVSDVVDLRSDTMATRRDGSAVAWDRDGRPVPLPPWLSTARAQRFVTTPVGGLSTHADCWLTRGRVWCAGGVQRWGARRCTPGRGSDWPDCGADVTEPVEVTLPARAVDLGISSDGGCALLEDRRVACWRSLRSGGGEGIVARVLPDTGPAVALAHDRWLRACALLESGRVRCQTLAETELARDARDLATDVLSAGAPVFYDAHRARPAAATRCDHRVADPSGTELRVRARPSSRAPEVGRLANGTDVTVASTRGSWARIEAPLAGWVYRPYLARCE